MQNGTTTTQHIISNGMGGGQIQISQKGSQNTGLVQNNQDPNIDALESSSMIQKHKKNKSQLSYATTTDNQKQVGSKNNFGPVHYHNNSGGVQTSAQDMMLDHNGNMIVTGDDTHMLI